MILPVARVASPRLAGTNCGRLQPQLALELEAAASARDEANIICHVLAPRLKPLLCPLPCCLTSRIAALMQFK